MDSLQIVANNSSQKIHYLNTHDLDEYISDAGMLFKSRQHHNQPTYEDYIQIDPRNAIATNVFSSSSVTAEIYCDDDKIDKLRRTYLEFELTNTHASTALQINPSEFCLEQIEQFIGDQSLGQVSALGNYIKNKFLMNFDELTVVSADEWIDPSDYSYPSTSIAAGATALVRIDVTGNLTGSGLNIFALNATGKKLKYKFTFSAVSNWAITASPSISVNKFKLVVEHTKYLMDTDRNAEKGRYLQGPVAIRYMDVRTVTEQKSHTASSEYYVDLSPLSGLSSCLFLSIRGSNPTGTNILNFKTATDIYINNGTTNIFSQKNRGDYLLRRAHSYFPSRITAYQKIYPVPFGEHTGETLHEGINTGSLALTTNHKFYYTPAATASDQIDIISVSYNYLIISGSNIRIAKSV